MTLLVAGTRLSLTAIPFNIISPCTMPDAMMHLPTELVERLPSLSRRFKSICSSNLLWKALYARDFPFAGEAGDGEACTSGEGAGEIGSCAFKEAYARQRVRMRTGNKSPAFPDLPAGEEGRDAGVDFVVRGLGGGDEFKEIMSGGRRGDGAGNFAGGGGRSNFLVSGGSTGGLDDGPGAEFEGFNFGGGFAIGGGSFGTGGEFEGFSLDGRRGSAVGMGGQFVRDVPIAFGGEHDRLPFTASP